PSLYVPLCLRVFVAMEKRYECFEPPRYKDTKFHEGFASWRCALCVFAWPLPHSLSGWRGIRGRGLAAFFSVSSRYFCCLPILFGSAAQRLIVLYRKIIA